MTTCSEVLRHLNPFLDSECGPEVTLAISEHLAVCSVCTERLAKEKRLEDRLTARLGTSEPGDAAMWRSLRTGLLARPMARRRAWVAGLAASLLLAVGLALHFRAHRPSDLVQAVCADHAKMLEGAHAPEVMTPSWSEAASGLKGHLPFSLTVSGKVPEALSLMGSRACALKTEPVALFSARLGNRPVSVAVLPVAALRSFPQIAREFEAKGDAFVCGDGTYRVGLAQRGNILVCVTGDVEGMTLGELASTLAQDMALTP